MKQKWYDEIEDYIRTSSGHALSGMDVDDLPRRFRYDDGGNRFEDINQAVIEMFRYMRGEQRVIRKWMRDQYGGIMQLCVDCGEPIWDWEEHICESD
jgi:hypothetical protein